MPGAIAPPTALECVKKKAAIVGPSAKTKNVENVVGDFC